MSPHIKTSLLGLIAACVVTTIACQPTARNATGPAVGAAAGSGTPSLGLWATAKNCGVDLSLDQGTGTGQRTATIKGSVELCNGWRALGLTVVSNQVYLRHGSSSLYDTSSLYQADVVIDDTNTVYARQGTTLTTLGTLAAATHAAIITQSTGVVIEVTVTPPTSEDPNRVERPYKVGDSKSTPDSDKHLFVTLPQ